jgi:hypothetical protein
MNRRRVWIVSISLREGIRSRISSPVVRRLAVIAGRAAFFAPLTVTVPRKGRPPRITSLSIAPPHPPSTDDSISTTQIGKNRHIGKCPMILKKPRQRLNLLRIDFEDELSIWSKKIRGLRNDSAVIREAVGTPIQGKARLIPNLGGEHLQERCGDVRRIADEAIEATLKALREKGLQEVAPQKGYAACDPMSGSILLSDPAGLSRDIRGVTVDLRKFSGQGKSNRA